MSKNGLLGESFIGEIGKVKGESRQASTTSTMVSRRLQYPGPHLASPSRGGRPHPDPVTTYSGITKNSLACRTIRQAKEDRIPKNSVNKF